jgi:hypothetical protein
MPPSLFRKSVPEKAAHGPAHAALLAQQALLRDAIARQKAKQRAVGLAHLDIDAAAELAASIAAQRKAIDARMGDARYAGEPMPDLTREKRELADAEAAHTTAADLARAATENRARYVAEAEVIAAEVRKLNEPLGELAAAALREQMASVHEEWSAAASQLRVVHRKVCRLGVAHDSIPAMVRRTFVDGMGAHELLRIPRLRLPPYTPDYADDLEKGRASASEVAAIRADYQAIKVEAERLLGELLYPKDTD